MTNFMQRNLFSGFIGRRSSFIRL